MLSFAYANLFEFSKIKNICKHKHYISMILVWVYDCFQFDFLVEISMLDFINKADSG